VDVPGGRVYKESSFTEPGEGTVWHCRPTTILKKFNFFLSFKLFFLLFFFYLFNVLMSKIK
jgi:hypothetical protein